MDEEDTHSVLNVECLKVEFRLVFIPLFINHGNKSDRQHVFFLKLSAFFLKQDQFLGIGTRLPG